MTPAAIVNEKRALKLDIGFLTLSLPSDPLNVVGE